MTPFSAFLVGGGVVVAVVLALLGVGLYFACSDSRSVQLGNYLPGAFADLEQFQKEEDRALQTMDERARQSYLAAKRWIEQNPPNSGDTDISLTQYLAIQDKGVHAWEFQYDLIHQPSVLVQNRIELEFRHDDVLCVQTNLPLPKQRDVYYWEIKIYELDPGTLLSVGLTTKPYPVFRLPGLHRYSVAYDSSGHRRLNQPFQATRYGRRWQRGDVIGVGYRTRTGTVFFTHNGRKLDDVVDGMKVNLFPTVGSTGPANVYVNLGQGGFVYLQANVKEWGLAPQHGTLAPPPAYGDQEDSLLLATTGDLAPPYIRRRSSDAANGSFRERLRANSRGELVEVDEGDERGFYERDVRNERYEDRDEAHGAHTGAHNDAHEPLQAQIAEVPAVDAPPEQDILTGDAYVDEEPADSPGSDAETETEAETEAEQSNSDADTETIGNADTATLTNMNRGPEPRDGDQV